MTATHKDLLDQAARLLRKAKVQTSEEIARYPTPISGCDAQFNHLLAERRRISMALDAIGSEVFIPTPRTPTRSAGIESR